MSADRTDGGPCVKHAPSRAPGDAVIRPECPNCHERAQVRTVQQQASCGRCGNVWDWTRKGLVKGVRS